MKPRPILTAGPSITEKEIAYVLDAVSHGWNEHWADYLKRFERTFAGYVGQRHALATSSCTGALHLALKALDIGPGDEVIIPEITWVATASAVVYTGATPIFADVEPDTWCMDPQSVAECISPRTRAIIPVHLYGHPTDMRAILELGRRHGLAILEDAAPALGAEVDGRKVGGLGDLAAFSFQGAKIMTTGEGGMLVTSDDRLYERLLTLADHGRDRHRPFWISEVGHKYKLSNVQAALGLAQLERIEDLVQKKRLIHDWYRERLEDMNEVQLNAERDWAKNIYWMTSIVLSPAAAIDRDEVMAALKAQGIDSRPFFPPVSSFPMFDSCALKNRMAYGISERGINLPSGHNLTEDDVDRVCEVLRQVFVGRMALAA